MSNMEAKGKLFLQSNGKGTACNPGPNLDIVGRYDA